MTDTYELHEPLPLLHQPVLVGMLTGWIDASSAAAGALHVLRDACATRPLATFDPDLFLDYRARRPTMELREGVNARLVWPTIQLEVGTDPNGRNVLVLHGPEPDSMWRKFAATVADLVAQLGVAKAAFFGAYPFATPHTRPSRLSSSSPSAELIASLPLLRNSVDVPAGIAAALEHSISERGIPALGLWAQVPHYLGTMSYPAASVALLEGLTQWTGVAVDTRGLARESEQQRERIDQLVLGNDEHRAMVRQLEEVYDDASRQQTLALGDGLGPSLSSGSLPTADELAEEFERFLREQGE